MSNEQNTPGINSEEETIINITNQDEKKNAENEQVAIKSNSKDIKKEKKEKKKSKFTLKRNKKKVALLADT